ncbi:MAG: AI-2E family transporter [Candidatus Limnocylindrales bacterium]
MTTHEAEGADDDRARDASAGDANDPAGAPPTAGSALAAIAGGPLGALAAVVLVMIGALALREVATLVVPVLFGLFLALVAWPMVGALERRGARHGAALGGAILVVLVVVLAVAVVVAVSIGELVVLVPHYEDRLQAQINALVALLAGFGVVLDPGAITSIISPQQVVSFIRPIASAVSGAGVGIFVLVLTMVYALFGAASLQARAEAAFGSDHALLAGVERFGVDLRRYLLVRAQLGVFAAVLSFGLLFVIGVPLPALWSFLVFAASFIPNIGTFVAVVPPLVLAFLTGGLGPALAIIVGYTLINFAQDHFLQPVVMGAELNLSPLVVFLSVLLWAWILGAAGALLAVPLTVALVSILEAHPSTRPIAALLRHTVSRTAQPPEPVVPVGA